MKDHTIPQTGVGLIGCGNISNAYFRGCKPYEHLKILACADLDVDRAKAKAAEHEIQRGCTVDELLADPEIGTVINLTVPQAHAEVAERILRAGKHAYSEKPLALGLSDATRVMDLAASCGLRVGNAPDTFFGAGLQTSRKLIDDGAIGTPVAGTAFMLSRGHEGWHPNPVFYYQKGGGPMLDMGPYYITALVHLLGPISRVCGSARASMPERLIRSQPFAGTRIPVEVPTHYAGTLDFVSGAVVTIVMSFDVYAKKAQPITLYGTEGTLLVPDPNNFDDRVSLFAGQNDIAEVPFTHALGRGRGSGVADMTAAIASGRPHRASGELALHALEVMLAVEQSSVEERHIAIKSRPERPAMIPVDLPANEMD